MIDFEKEQWLEGMSNDDILNGLRHPYSIDYVYDGNKNTWVLVHRYTDGFRIIGELLLESAAERLEVSSFVNKVLAIRAVLSGEVVRYDKDRDMVSYVVGEDHQIEQRSEGKYVYPPEVEYAAYPNIKAGKFLQDTKLTGMELARIQLKAFNSMQYQQDRDLIALLMKAGEDNQIKADLMEIFQNLVYQIEKECIRCASILMNTENARFIKENKDKFPGVDLNEEQLTGGLVEYGHFGFYGKTALLTQSQSMTEALRYEKEKDLIPKDTMIAVAPKEYIGGAPVRIDWMSEPNEEEVEGVRAYGWFWYKLMSMLVIDPKTVAMGKIKR